MDLQWTVYVQRGGTAELVKIASAGRLVNGATPADFGLSIPEARALLANLQQVVAQHQVAAYDEHRRPCRHCGRSRRIKDWRTRTIATGLGKVTVRVPRVVSCLCAKNGASTSYRRAARAVADLAGLDQLCHATVRTETIACGEHIENAQFHVGWYAGGRKAEGARHLRVAIDGTVLTASTGEQCSKFEVIAGRVECDGRMGRRFVSAMQRPTLTRVLVAAALEQCDWVPQTLVDVVTDGALGMRSTVTSVAPNVAPRILDWFHLGMKLHAVKSPLFARPLDWREPPELIRRSGKLWQKTRDALWRGRGEKAIELVRMLIASLKEAVPILPAFYAGRAMTAAGAADALLQFLVNNRCDLINYQRARMSGRRVSSASAESVMNHMVNSRMSKRQ